MIPSSASKSEIQNKLGFKIGDRIKHTKFGLGLIKEMTDKKVIVQFVDGDKEIANIIADKFLTKVD